MSQLSYDHDKLHNLEHFDHTNVNIIIEDIIISLDKAPHKCDCESHSIHTLISYYRDNIISNKALRGYSNQR